MQSVPRYRLCHIYFMISRNFTLFVNPTPYFSTQDKYSSCNFSLYSGIRIHFKIVTQTSETEIHPLIIFSWNNKEFCLYHHIVSVPEGNTMFVELLDIVVIINFVSRWSFRHPERQNMSTSDDIIEYKGIILTYL